MKKEKTVRTYQRRTKSGKMVTVHEHKASYDAAEEARKAAAKKAGAGSELSKKKAAVEENPLGFSADDYKEWYHWDMDSDPKNEAALRVEKALTKKMGKRAYNKYLEDMTNSYTARGHKKTYQALLDEHTTSQKKQDAESVKAAKDIARGAKEKSPTSSNDKENRIRKYSDHVKHLLQLNKLGEKDPMMGSYIAEQKKILQDLKKYKGELLSPSEIGVTTDSFAKKHKLSYEEDGIYSDKSGKTYRISTNPITGKSTLHPMVGSTIGATTPKKKETKGDRAVARMNKLVNEALSSTTSDPKTLKKQLGALIDYNGGPVNRGDKIGKRIDEIREQLGKRSSKKKGYKKSDYDYETSMKNLENYFAEERRKSTSKGKTTKLRNQDPKHSQKSPKTSVGTPTSADLRKQADEMDAKAYKETSKATHKKLIEKGYKKHTYQGTTYYHKGKEGSYGGSYVMLDKNGKQRTVPPYMKEGMKAQIARSVGKTYKPRRLK